MSGAFDLAVAPGIRIRQFRLPDAEPVWGLVEKHREYLGQWLPWVEETKSAADIADFISRAQAQFDENRGPQMAIVVDGEIQGSIGCHPIDWPNWNSSIGYWVAPPLQGRGIVSRCSAVLLDHLFGEMHLHRVEIRCGTGNTRSCAVPERLGFTREGVAREAEWVSGRWVDLVVWSMLASEWRSGGRGPAPDPAA